MEFNYHVNDLLFQMMENFVYLSFSDNLLFQMMENLSFSDNEKLEVLGDRQSGKGKKMEAGDNCL